MDLIARVWASFWVQSRGNTDNDWFDSALGTKWDGNVPITVFHVKELLLTLKPVCLEIANRRTNSSRSLSMIGTADKWHMQPLHLLFEIAERDGFKPMGLPSGNQIKVVF